MGTEDEGNREYFLRELEDMQPGDHTSLIYDSDDDLQRVMVAFVREGFARNQRVFYIAEPVLVEPILSELRSDSDIELQRRIDTGQFHIHSTREVYLRHGRFDPETMIELLRKATTQARDDGYTALRVTGDMSWALQDVVGGDRLLEYESQLNEFYPGSDALSICQYDRRRFSAEMILQVLQAHPTVIIGTQFARNAYHIPPNEMHSQQLATYRLNRWLRNIQDLKAERQAREQTERELRSALDEKEQLLRELNHRVKNSLLMVSSLMSLKERTSRAPQDLTEVKTFVNTIQLIHDKLYQADDMEHVAFAPYLRELLADIVSLFPGPEVQLDIDVPDVALPTSPAVNLGLILNELTTNALKYGFEEVSVPRITVALVWEDDHREYVLTFSNNGPPLPERFNLRALPTGGLGTQLIRSFVEKMDGSIEVQRAPHPQFTIRFSA